jgi:hypothetical protein
MSKKYEIIKNGTDDYTLKYKDKEFNFKTELKIMAKMQNANKKARTKMVMDLTKQGISMKDLTIEKKENGKTYLDNSNKVEIEKAYIDDETTNVFSEICEEKFGMDLTTLVLDIDLKEDEMEQFATELIQALTGKTPS